MTSHIFGLGPGLVIIFTLWIVAFLVFFISLRLEKRFGSLGFILAAIITLILVTFPRAPQHPVVQEEKNKPYDHYFVWRLALLFVLVTSSVIGFIGYVNFGLMDVARPQRIKNWVL